MFTRFRTLPARPGNDNTIQPKGLRGKNGTGNGVSGDNYTVNGGVCYTVNEVSEPIILAMQFVQHIPWYGVVDSERWI